MPRPSTDVQTYDNNSSSFFCKWSWLLLEMPTWNYLRSVVLPWISMWIAIGQTFVLLKYLLQFSEICWWHFCSIRYVCTLSYHSKHVIPLHFNISSDSWYIIWLKHRWSWRNLRFQCHKILHNLGTGLNAMLGISRYFIRTLFNSRLYFNNLNVHVLSLVG